MLELNNGREHSRLPKQGDSIGRAELRKEEGMQGGS